MHQEANWQNARGIAGAGIGGGNLTATPTRTISARLEAAAYMLLTQCGRIEDVLARVNGTPRNPPHVGQEKESTAAPMAQSVEALEQQVKRLCDLANNLEQVA